MRDLLIVGASVRAASESARRAGFSVTAADLFADQDLQQIADCHRVTDYPAGLAKIRAQFSDRPVMYTGAIENYPAMVDRMADAGPLYGNSGNVLRAVRDPCRLRSCLQRAAIPQPRLLETRPDTKVDTNADAVVWLRKLKKSAAGQHVAFLEEQTFDESDASSPAEVFYQEFIPGRPCSAAFVAVDGTVQMIGVTEMLVGATGFNATGFAYCGSITKNTTPDESRMWLRIGQALVSEFGLNGVFGVDAICRVDGSVVPIEVNPRYTASMEVLELVDLVSIAGAHVHAYSSQSHAAGAALHTRSRATLGESADEVGEESSQQSAPRIRQYGKAILYCPQNHPVFTFPDYFDVPEAALRIADVPMPGERILGGQPILTLIMAGESSASVVDRLGKAATEVYERLFSIP